MSEQASHRDEAELLQLIGELINGVASADQRARLDALLAGSEDFRAIYRRYINLHVALRTLHHMPGSSLEQTLAEALRENSPNSDNIDAATRRGLSRRSVSRGRYLAMSAIAIAATAAMLIGVAVLLHRDSLNNAKQGRLSGQAVIARVTKTSAARWTSKVIVGDDEEALAAGDLVLADGFAEVRFDSGARVVLEAPVDMRLVDSQNAKLRSGRIVAYVPPPARGFAIETPRAKVVDFGTEFGVDVRGNDTEVQVFKGVVVTQWRDPRGATKDHRMEAGQAVSIDEHTAAAPKAALYDPEGYVRTFPTDASDEPGGPLYNRSHFNAVHVTPAPKNLVIDGDLSDWDRSGAFFSACLPPYHESYYLEGMMMYDREFVYIGAHVGDPDPLRSIVNTDAEPAWRGGSVIVRLAVNPELGWPLKAVGPAEGDRLGDPKLGRRPIDIHEQIVHLTMWYHQPTAKPRLLFSYGMNFQSELKDPPGWRGAYRVDPNGRGYMLEYAIPWSLLNAADCPPKAGDVVAANWTVHWSDREGKLSRGKLIEITNLDEKPYRFLRASTWGKAIFHDKGNLSPSVVGPLDSSALPQ